jgi:hypothetical protein
MAAERLPGGGSFMRMRKLITSAIASVEQRLLTSIYEEIEEFGFSVGDSTVNNPIYVIQKIALHFHAVARQLRARHADRETLDVKDEYDLQELQAFLRKWRKRESSEAESLAIAQSTLPVGCM